MTGPTALLKTWKGPKPAHGETESLIGDSKVRDVHQGIGIKHDHDPANDAGYLAAKFLLPLIGDFPLAPRGGPPMTSWRLEKFAGSPATG